MEQIILNLVPGGVSPVCYVSQYDVGRKIRLHLRNGSDPYVLSGAETVTATIRKVSGEELIYDIANTSASYVDLIVNYDATDVIGESVCELVITESGIRLGSANFKMRVDPDVYSGDQKLEVVSATSENPDLSFETNVEENLLELKAGFSPVQDLHGYDSPWIDSNVVNKKPYLLRAIAGTASRIGTHEYNKIVGGTVAFNQLVPIASSSKTETINTVVFTDNRDGTYTVNGTASGDCTFTVVSQKTWQAHKYILVGGASGGSTSKYSLAMRGAGSDTFDFGSGAIWDANGNTWKGIVIYVKSGQSLTNLVFKPQIIDLTAMFGSTIADYIYSLEQATAGAGVAWFKALFPKDYYAYNAGELISVKTSAHITRGFNQWDEVMESGSIDNDTGENVPSASDIRGKNFMPVLPNTAYCFTNLANDKNLRAYWYDKSKNFIVSTYITTNNYRVETSPINAYYCRIRPTNNYGTTYNHDICINISDPARNGEYEPYVKHAYPLDPDLELRGIPKLDENNNLYYDGDEYASDGGVKRRYGVVDLGSLTWTINHHAFYGDYFYTTIDFIKYVGAFGVTKYPLLCHKYITVERSGNTFVNHCLCADGAVGTVAQIQIKDDNYSDVAAFKASLSGVYLVYEKATPTTETADPFTDPQEIDPNGSEEFVDTRSVSIPVGHESYYANICEIEGWNEVNVLRTGENLIPTIEPQTGSASNVTAVVGEDGVITLNGTSNANGSIILETNNAGLFVVPMIDNLYVRYFNNFENGSIALVFELNDGTNFGPSFNSINKIYKIPTESLGKVVWRIRIYFLSGQSFNNAKFSPMITIGNSETTYKKYDEVQTINLDWNTNQWDEDLETDTYINSNTGVAYPETGRCASSFIPLLYNKIYLKIPDSTGNWRICYYKADKTYLGSDYSIVINASAELTIPEGAYYMRFGTGASYGTTYNHDISINYPSTDHAYHPYRGHGVAYAGEVVYKDGGWKLRLLSTIADLGDLTWYPGACALENKKTMRSESIANIVLAPPTSSILVDILCPVYPTKTGDQTYLGTTGISILRGGTVAVFDERYSSADSVNVFKSAMSGVKLVYPLATPIEIPLDQNSKLATVLGINNLMHDANGGTEVKFFRMISAS